MKKSSIANQIKKFLEIVRKKIDKEPMKIS
jgi:hypothetical protein